VSANEKWKSIKGYEGLYEVSSKGRIRSLDRYVKYKGSTMFKKGKELKQRYDPKSENHFQWYRTVELYDKDGNRKIHMVHRLVAIAFIPNPDNKSEVNHIIPISEGGLDNIENLEWVTHDENIDHATKHGLYKSNKNNLTKEQRQEFIAKASEACKKKVIMVDKTTNKPVREFNSASEAAEFLKKPGIRSHINAVCKGKRKTAGGYKWVYSDC